MQHWLALVTSLIKKVWDVSWDMWIHGNNVLHNGHYPQRTVEIAKSHALIEKEYQIGCGNLLPRDQHWFLKPKETLFKQKDGHKQRWLASIFQARRQATTDADTILTSLGQERRLLAWWLHQEKNPVADPDNYKRSDSNSDTFEDL